MVWKKQKDGKAFRVMIVKPYLSHSPYRIVYRVEVENLRLCKVFVEKINALLNNT